MGKKITEMQLISSVTDGLNIPSDNGIQSYRYTALQMKNYILANNAILTAMILDGNVTRAKLDGLITSATHTGAGTAVVGVDLNLISSAGGAYTITLPAANTATGRLVKFAKTSSDTNIITVGTYPVFKKGQILELFSDGTNWIAINEALLNATNRVTAKSLASNLTSSTTNIASLGFSNLIVGKVYRVDLKIDWNGNTSGQLSAIHNGGTVATARHGTGGTFNGLSAVGIFTAAATTLTHNYTLGGTGNLVANGAEGTRVILTELNNTALGSFF